VPDPVGVGGVAGVVSSAWVSSETWIATTGSGGVCAQTSDGTTMTITEKMASVMIRTPVPRRILIVPFPFMCALFLLADLDKRESPLGALMHVRRFFENKFNFFSLSHAGQGMDKPFLSV
jgi:hypothetical protein